MADVAKVITIIGSSSESFAKAADAAVQEASRTIRGITGADVVSMSAVVKEHRIVEYRTTVNVAFAVEREHGGGGGGHDEMSGEEEFEGHGGTVEAALENAYENAQKSPRKPKKLRLIDLHVEGTNPITGYRVLVKG